LKNKLNRDYFDANLHESNTNLREFNLRKSAFKKVFSEFTDFEIRVLKATLKIPFGKTRSYKWVAKEIGLPKAVRAVGAALKKNPYPLIIPCHRVVKSSGEIGGYALGKKLKAYLIALERRFCQKLAK